MNVLDFYRYLTDPAEKLRRFQARQVLDKVQGRYEGATPSRLRPDRRDNSSPNALVAMGAVALRAHARYLERNHDLSRGALRVLVNNVVGPRGIGVEPTPRRADGTIHTEYAAVLRRAYAAWARRPEVTRRMHWALCQRTAAYTWFRDGECFAQEVVGNVPGLAHSTAVPYSLEMFEPDFVPMDYNDHGNRIRQGIQTNAWGKPTNFFVYKADPREGGSWFSANDIKPVSADRVLHVATFDRFHQLRGVSEFASVVGRVEDLKDYEESERIAAKIAASLTGYVKRLPGDGGYEPPAADIDSKTGEVKPRQMQMAPGMIIDTLKVGEEIGLIDSKRPNPNLITWRSGQLRAFAAGIGASYSSVSRDYNGTYSSQRQELVEQWVHYAVLVDEFAGMLVQPTYSRIVQLAHLSGAAPMPRDVDPAMAGDCLLVGQEMPWINPRDEASAFQLLAQSGFMSEPEIIRRRGGNPSDTLQQSAKFREEARGLGLVLSSDAANTGGGAAPTATPAPAGPKGDDEPASTRSSEPAEEGAEA